MLAGGVADIGPGSGVEIGGVADFIGNIPQAAVEAVVPAIEQVAHRGPQVIAGRVPLPGFERVGVPALGPQLVAKQAQVNLVIGRKAIEGERAQRNQVLLGECVIALALGRVGNHQQRVVFVEALTGSIIGVLPPQRLDKPVFKSIEAGIGTGGSGGFIGAGAAGSGQSQQR